jgi:primosomal protein N'
MYTPQFSNRAAISVRRLAWALNLPMTKTMDEVISLLPSLFSPSLICPKCKDTTKCKLCGFNKQAAENNAALSA